MSLTFINLCMGNLKKKSSFLEGAGGGVRGSSPRSLIQDAARPMNEDYERLTDIIMIYVLVHQWHCENHKRTGGGYEAGRVNAINVAVPDKDQNVTSAVNHARSHGGENIKNHIIYW